MLIYDRGYPSMGLIKYHYKHGLDFLMRVSNSSFKAVQEFQRSKKVDEIIEIEVTRGIFNNLAKEKQHPNLKALIQELNIGDKLKIRAIF